MAAVPKEMTAAEFFGTPDLIEQLRAAARTDPWAIPCHLVHDLCVRALDALEANP